jgi:hypothetical protein
LTVVQPTSRTKGRTIWRNSTTPTASAQSVNTSKCLNQAKLTGTYAGVLTKPDRIPPGEEDRWLRFIRNECETLENGWYCVKQPNSKTLSQGILWSEARKQENDYFSMTPPWSSLETTYQNYLRTSNLTERLSIILSELISKRSVAAPSG